MAASTAISYLAGRGILAHPERKRIYVWAAVASDLAILGFFKYTGFAFRSANGLAHLLGWDVTLPTSCSGARCRDRLSVTTGDSRVAGDIRSQL